ncbi:MAG TPA: MFS transporter [Plasticicumulans sp.]|uniref:MFS transporter n=1 Tax=Plasticicumulans sp. TaxID=2307179 RepID=UPI002C9C30A1|nr:MFS transporter [Plasticicumulans sp.]HNG50327.1 MFS transporter [Plasticicumulans sp.]
MSSEAPATTADATTADAAVPPPAGAPASAWSPLRHRTFRWLWLAAIASNIGTWMHEVGAGWLMTTLSPSPLLVSLVQAAGAAPMFVLALPAGALSDIVDRRRFLIGVQIWMALVAAALAAATLTGAMTPGLLLGLTAALGIGSALMAPAWAALTPELVPKPELQSAIALSSVGINVARAIGPALAGLIVSSVGPWATFALNAASFAGVIVVLAGWRRPQAVATLPSERFFGALRAGWRYARSAPRLQAVIVRALAFFVFASAGLGLLPLLVRRLPDGSAGVYGALLACVGVGAVGGAFLLPKLRERVSADQLVAGASALYAGVLLALALLPSAPWLAPVMLASGAAWIAVLSSFQVAAQTAAPPWVRARALAVYMLAFNGAMAAGAALWGTIAAHQAPAVALVAAAAGLLLLILPVRRFRLACAAADDLSPSLHWPMPLAEGTAIEHDRGPVLVTVEYEIPPAHAAAFVQAMQAMARVRRRNGALSWGLFQDTDRPQRWVEYFIDESWLEHLRHHGRITHADAEIEARVRALHSGPHGPRIHHHVGPPAPGSGLLPLGAGEG